MKRIITLLAVLISIQSILVGQVIINEYSASNLRQFRDNYDKTEDWIELYNTSTDPVDISGWHLSDKKNKLGKWEIPQGTIIESNGFLVFWCSDRNEVSDGHYHTNFKLSQTGGKDRVILTDASEGVIDKLEMIITLVEHSICRAEDGGTEWVVCTNPTLGTSNNNSSQYSQYTTKPTMNLEAGFYTGMQTVSLSNEEGNSILRYTTNGSIPTEQSSIYSSPISIEVTTVIKARAFSNDQAILPGLVEFNTYFIDEEFSLPVFSVASEEVILLANGDGELKPVGTLEYFNLDKEREAISYGDLNRHGQDSWILPHRSLDWVSRDERGYNKEIKAALFDYSERDGYQRIMFRNSGDDNYPANDDDDHVGSTHIRDEYVQTLSLEGGMKLDTRAVSRVILFLNGKYWGLYGMREKPVDHDYTKEYYDQGKYDIQYLSTWETTQARYGGEKAFEDWATLRDFVLDDNTNMSLSSNYDELKEEYDVLSLCDYFIANQNVVAKDWLNYNTGWWRGLDAEGQHKKWGYILWDLDATFDYYINYTDIPNEGPDAQPCDIYDISDAMDDFFTPEVIDSAYAEGCLTILNGTCPYPAADTIFIQVIQADEYCCNGEWDDSCDDLYSSILNGTSQDTCESILNGSCPYTMEDSIFQIVIEFEPSCCEDGWNGDCQAFYDEVEDYFRETEGHLFGNVGKHEKIFIKLLEDNAEFKQLYYSRYADLMNTVYSCDNMITTLDRMLAVIEPEMPKQIERWGGTMTEWQQNVVQLKDYIEARCGNLEVGLVDCYDLTGPYNLTLDVEPEGVAKVVINTITPESLSWTGQYFGGMENLIETAILPDYEEDYIFSHWESKANNNIIGENSNKASIELIREDTLIAVYKLKTGQDELLNSLSFGLYPNPTSDHLAINFTLKKKAKVEIQLYSILGQHLACIECNGNALSLGQHQIKTNLKTLGVSRGVYLVRIKADDTVITKKITVL